MCLHARGKTLARSVGFSTELFCNVDSIPCLLSIRGGYDDAYTVALVWNILGPAIRQRHNASHTAEKAKIASLRRSEEERLNFELASGLVPPDVDGRKRQEEIGEAAKRAVAASGIEIQGSCECFCKAESGRGVCFNIGVGAGTPTKDSDKCGSLPHVKDPANTLSFMYKQADYCSPLGTPMQCNLETDIGKNICNSSLPKESRGPGIRNDTAFSVTVHAAHHIILR